MVATHCGAVFAVNEFFTRLAEDANRRRHTRALVGRAPLSNLISPDGYARRQELQAE